MDRMGILMWSVHTTPSPSRAYALIQSNPRNINCNITSSALLLETKSVIRVEHIATCWDLNPIPDQPVWAWGPSRFPLSRDVLGPQVSGAQRKGSEIFTSEGRSLDNSILKIVLFPWVLVVFLSLFGKYREGKTSSGGSRRQEAFQSNWSSSHAIPS